MEERRKEREERAAERILEQRNLELEMEDRRLARVAEVKRMEYELRKLELTRRTDRYERQEGEEGENMRLDGGQPDTRSRILWRAYQNIRGRYASCFPKMPSVSTEVPNFSQTVNKLFVMY